MHLHRRLAPLLALPLLVAVTSCRTRPFDVGTWVFSEDAAVPVDSSVPGDAASDLADLGPIPPDYNFPLFDLTIPRSNCGAYTIQTTVITHADLLIVQDRSRSMAQGIDGGNNPGPGMSKWEQVSAAIQQVVSRTNSIDWGLMLYGNGSQCGVNQNPDVPIAPNNGAIIRQVLQGTVLAPSTPTTLAISNAVAYLQGLKDKHPHYLMVATDGQPTCPGGNGNGSDATAAIAAVRAAAGAGIPVFVVGIGTNTGAEQTLDSMGKAGGVPNTRPGEPANYTVTSTQDLITLLDATALRITPCIYALPAEPPDPGKVTFQGRGGEIVRDTKHVDGWDFSDDGMSVVFYGPACDVLKAGAITSVDTVYGCPGD